MNKIGNFEKKIFLLRKNRFSKLTKESIIKRTFALETPIYKYIYVKNIYT